MAQLKKKSQKMAQKIKAEKKFAFCFRCDAVTEHDETRRDCKAKH